MLQPSQHAADKLRADLIFQHDIERASSLEQGVFAVEKIPRCVWGFPNTFGLSPHGSEARDDGALPWV
jgi:hypothetical protein